MHRGFESLAVSFAFLFGLGAAASAQTDDLVARAKGYANKSLADFHIDPSGGIGRSEAKIIGDVMVLGWIDFDQSHVKIVSYSEPVSDGAFWRIDMVQDASVAAADRRGPLFIGKLSGRSFCNGWFNCGGPMGKLGEAEFLIDDWSGPPELNITLKRVVRPNDVAAKKEIKRCANEITDHFNARSAASLEPIRPEDIEITEEQISHQSGRPDRTWAARIVLRLRKPAPKF